jgi:hypothetical protein
MGLGKTIQVQKDLVLYTKVFHICLLENSRQKYVSKQNFHLSTRPHLLTAGVAVPSLENREYGRRKPSH